jgi:predicted enzyme related to lactoylglutathione lyase
MSRVMHFEMGADNPERALRFYEKVFGWKYEKWGDQKYWLIRTGERGSPGIDGAIQPRSEQLAPVVNTIVVDDIDKTAMDITENGGTIIVPKMDIPKVGLLLYFKDTEGNISGVMQPYPME